MEAQHHEDVDRVAARRTAFNGESGRKSTKRRAVQQLQEAYENHFRQGLRFVEEVSWQFRKNDRAFLREQMQERVFSLHDRRKSILKRWKKPYNKKKEIWKTKPMKSPIEKEKPA
ncbi:DUF3958 family protein [Listeria aquatica]|uniref:DUF3958 family protein n=1 Tax=Listeria aquatica TaxID=1494960 RepID=UPI0031F50A12